MEAESASPSKLTIPVTERLKVIVKEIAKNSVGRVNETETWYFRDVARGHYQTADFARIAFGARRSSASADRREFLAYVKGLVVADTKPVMPRDRAHLRRANEASEANVAVETYRYQPCATKAERVIRENKDLIAALEAENASIAAEHQLSA